MLCLGAVLDSVRERRSYAFGELDVAFAELDRQLARETRKKSSVSSCECQTNSPCTLTSWNS